MFQKLKFILRNPLQLPIILVQKIPYFRFITETDDYQCRITFELWFIQKILNFGNSKKAYWPTHYTSKVYDIENIYVGIDTYPGFSNGCYIQGKGGIVVGDYTQIAPNVIIVSANHDVYDSRKHICSSVKIGKYCWIGAGAKIMPGVTLGDWTIVGAGAVVTKSFEGGHCVLGGVPAKLIKMLDKEKCIPFKNKIDYNGYIRSDKFQQYRSKYLKV